PEGAGSPCDDSVRRVGSVGWVWVASDVLALVVDGVVRRLAREGILVQVGGIIDRVDAAEVCDVLLRGRLLAGALGLLGLTATLGHVLEALGEVVDELVQLLRELLGELLGARVLVLVRVGLGVLLLLLLVEGLGLVPDQSCEPGGGVARLLRELHGSLAELLGMLPGVLAERVELLLGLVRLA